MENNETNVPRIIAMANMKGGVGKTTSTICTAIALNKLGRKVEVRDIDPQGSATLWATKARAAGEPLPFDVRVANRFTVTMPPSDPDTWVLIDTPPMKRFVKCFFELLTQIIVKVRKRKVQRVCVLHFQLAGSGGCFFLMKLYH